MQSEKTTGQIMKERRKQLGMSAEFLANKIGVNPSTVYRYEKGDIDKMPLNNLIPIAKALYTTPMYLMGWEDDPEPEPLFLDPDEDMLLDFYRSLNIEGKAAAMSMMRGLINTDIYKKSNPFYPTKDV